MSKKIEKQKTATFCLEPDGFSIHTFELTRGLTGVEYGDLKDKLYRKYPGTYAIEPEDIKQMNMGGSYFSVETFS